MTPTKHFNTYDEGLDLEFMREYCMEHGERRMTWCGDMLKNVYKANRKTRRSRWR